MDPASLAAAALALVGPFLLGLGKTAVDESAKSAGKSVWEWISGKLTSPAGKEAVQEAESAPQVPENLKALEATLAKVLAKSPEAAAELEKLLPAGAVSGGQTANVTGSGNKVGQADRGGSVTIG